MKGPTTGIIDHPDGANNVEAIYENIEALLNQVDRSLTTQVEPGAVLLVDDTPEVLNLLHEAVEALGYKVFSASDAEQASQIYQASRNRLSCVIADYHMPKRNGLDMLKDVKRYQPDASLVLLSGQADLSMALQAINSGTIFRFMLKPIRNEELRQVLEDCVKRYLSIGKEHLLQNNVYNLALWLKEAKEKLEDNLDQIIEVYSDLIAIYSPYLIEVDKVTRAFCQKLCQFQSLSPKEAKTLMLAANFHNIGLLGIPRQIIKISFHRQNELTESELKLIRQHPKVSAEQIDFFDESRIVSEVILAHHERWDGKGYPRGLRGDMIPRLSQYLALAAYYAESPFFGQNLIYRIQKEEGALFGPEATNAFEELRKNDALPLKVKEVNPDEILSGSMLARDVLTSDRSLLISKGTELSARHIQQMRMRAEENLLELPIYLLTKT